MIRPGTGRAAEQAPQPPDGCAAVAQTGLVPGTVVLTQDGETPVEFLAPGDRIITRDAGLVRLARIGRTRHRLRAIRFAAGSLDHTRPGTDTVLPAGQLVLLRDWRAQAMFGVRQALVRAETLVDRESIRDLGPRPMVLHRLYFADTHVIYAGGLELASGAAGAGTPRPMA